MRARLLPLTLLIALVATACSGSSNDDDASDDAGDTTEAAAPGADEVEEADGPWTFEDDLGVVHELPEVPETIVAEVTVAGALWDLGIQVDATFNQRELPDGTTDPLGLADPDAMQSLGEEYGKVNLEELRVLDPDIIVTPSYQNDEYWGIDAEITEQVEATAPVVAITVPDKDLRQMADRILDLAVSLGVDPEGETVTDVVAQYEEAEARLRDAIEAKPGLTFIAASGTVDQLYVAVPSGYIDLKTYQGLGMDIVEPDTDEEFWETLSWEQIDKYEADVLLGDSRGGSVDQIVEAIPEGARDIPAIQADQLARWEVFISPGYANLARVLGDLTEVVEGADPDVV